MVAVQGIHVIEHVIQLIQVYVFGVPDDDGRGLLGYFFVFHGTEEWLHLLFNMAYVASLYVPLVPATAPHAAGNCAGDVVHVVRLRCAPRAGTSSSTS